jgi:cardiolipin synthase C
MTTADSFISALGIKENASEESRQSGFGLSQTSKQALEWRLMLIDQAQRTIDLQYFIWHNDFSGRLLFYRILRAANRGVKIRLLVDDMPLESSDEDPDVAYVDHHPNINIKVFNPSSNRFGWRRLVEYVTFAGKLNHRMHNKLLIVDDKAAIVGGRNIGDEYFGLHEEMNFADLDGIVFGKAARSAGASFQSYWQSEWAVEAKKLFPQNDGNEQKKFLVELAALTAETKKLEQFSLEPIDWRDSIIALKKRLVPGLAESIQDDPTELNVSHMSLAGKAIDRIANKATKELFISSPYFIPNRSMLKGFSELIKRGVKIKILTNSLMTNNHIAAHSGYIKFRKKILSRGIELYELHHDAQLRDHFDTPPVHSNLLGLHAKTVIIDRKKVFVGSLNFDPRAIYLNSEAGLMIDSPALAENTAQMFDRLILPENSWRVTMHKFRKLLWSSSLGNHHKEPMRDFRQKVRLTLLYLLPIEKQL